MTVSQALIQWLYGFGSITVDESIDTDTLAANAAAYGLYKTPQKTVIPYVDGSRDVTAYYTFCVRQRANQDVKRRNNQEWMEGLETWVRARQLKRELPVLTSGRDCQTVFIANSFTMQDAEKDEAVYQLTIAVNYIEQAA